jgi:hypothetical protein
MKLAQEIEKVPTKMDASYTHTHTHTHTQWFRYVGELWLSIVQFLQIRNQGPLNLSYLSELMFFLFDTVSSFAV